MNEQELSSLKTKLEEKIIYYEEVFGRKDIKHS